MRRNTKVQLNGKASRVVRKERAIKVQLNGTIYRVVTKKWLDKTGLGGSCNWGKHVIALAPSLSSYDHLDASLHEGLHAEFPDSCEEAIYRKASEMAHYLWSMGYRRVKPTTQLRVDELEKAINEQVACSELSRAEYKKAIGKLRENFRKSYRRA